MKLFKPLQVNFSEAKYFLDTKLKNAVAKAEDKRGTLRALAQVFQKQHINLTYLSTHLLDKKINSPNCYHIELSYLAQDSINFDKLKNSLASENIGLTEEGPLKVPWFPRNLEEMNKIGQSLQDVKEDKSAHEAFTDQVYRQRRDQIAQAALSYKIGQPIHNVNYTQNETNLWCGIYGKLSTLHKKAMSQRFLKQISLLEKEFKIDRRIPQLSELSDYLRSRTGFSIKPTHGILSQREFLNAFAFKIFCSTQYLRHHKTPDYTPQPDIVHEIIGHVPMFADPQVAQISHKIGLLSLGASDEQVKMLGALYWFTLQFGVCKEDNQILGYGAGVASSIGEIEHMISQKAKFKKLIASEDSREAFPVQTVQELYRVTESFQKSLGDLESFGRTIRKPVTTIYNQKTREIQYDRNIQAVFREDIGPKF